MPCLKSPDTPYTPFIGLVVSSNILMFISDIFATIGVLVTSVSLLLNIFWKSTSAGMSLLYTVETGVMFVLTLESILLKVKALVLPSVSWPGSPNSITFNKGNSLSFLSLFIFTIASFTSVI